MLFLGHELFSMYSRFISYLLWLDSLKLYNWYVQGTMLILWACYFVQSAIKVFLRYVSKLAGNIIQFWWTAWSTFPDQWNPSWKSADHEPEHLTTHRLYIWQPGVSYSNSLLTIVYNLFIYLFTNFYLFITSAMTSPQCSITLHETVVHLIYFHKKSQWWYEECLKIT